MHPGEIQHDTTGSLHDADHRSFAHPPVAGSPTHNRFNASPEGTRGLASPQVVAGRARTAANSNYSKRKIRKEMKDAKNHRCAPSHHRMKKILLVATVVVGGLTFAQAGVNVSIGIGLPLPPLPGVVIRQPAPYCPPPVYVARTYCPPRVVVPCAPPVRYQPVCGPRYNPHGHYREYDRHGHGHNGHGHRR